MKRLFGGETGEIIGPAGAGKSSLAEYIRSSENGVQAGASVWRLPRRSLARTTFRFLPELLRLRCENGDFAAADMKRLLRLETLYQTLAANAARSNDRRRRPRLVLMDEGWIFTLAKIRVERGCFPGWIDDARLALTDRWGEILKTIVWLDAPNELLIERIRRRDKAHRMKSQPVSEFERFLDLYRTAYEAIVERLRRAGDLKVLRFDTAHDHPEEITRRIIAETSPARRSGGTDNKREEFGLYAEL